MAVRLLVPVLMVAGVLVVPPTAAMTCDPLGPVSTVCTSASVTVSPGTAPGAGGAPCSTSSGVKTCYFDVVWSTTGWDFTHLGASHTASVSDGMGGGTSNGCTVPAAGSTNYCYADGTLTLTRSTSSCTTLTVTVTLIATTTAATGGSTVGQSSESDSDSESLTGLCS